MSEEFKREDRYIVIKRSDLATRHPKERELLQHALWAIGKSPREYLVIESDWPEYEPAWHMIERRVNGVAGRLPEVVAVINEEGEHFKETVVEHRPGIDRLPVGTELVDRAHVNRLQAELDALQQRLNAADQRIDDAVQYMRRTVDLVLRSCGNSYANAWCEKLLVIAKNFGAYNGSTIGNIIDLREAFQEAEDSKIIGIERMPPMEYDEP